MLMKIIEILNLFIITIIMYYHLFDKQRYDIIHK